jgi:hypothetical protein
VILHKSNSTLRIVWRRRRWSAKRAVVRFNEPPVGLVPNGVALKAARCKPSGEKPCDIEDIPSLTGVLAHCPLHEFNAVRHQADGGHER